MKKITFGLFILLLSFSACKRDSDTGLQNIPVDISKAKTHLIDETNIIPLETNDSSVIYEIETVVNAEDKWYVLSRDFLRIFDSNTGKFLGNLTSKGHGPGEFLNIKQLWNDGDTIRILDSNKQCVMDYLPSKGYIGKSLDFSTIKEKYNTSPNYLTPVPDGSGYYIINTWFGGSKESNPEFSYIDASCKELIDVPGREMTDGFFLPTE